MGIPVDDPMGFPMGFPTVFPAFSRWNHCNKRYIHSLNRGIFRAKQYTTPGENHQTGASVLEYIHIYIYIILYI
jgi:hypothetical protein